MDDISHSDIIRKMNDDPLLIKGCINIEIKRQFFKPVFLSSFTFSKADFASEAHIALWDSRHWCRKQESLQQDREEFFFLRSPWSGDAFRMMPSPIASSTRRFPRSWPVRMPSQRKVHQVWNPALLHILRRVNKRKISNLKTSCIYPDIQYS